MSTAYDHSPEASQPVERSRLAVLTEINAKIDEMEAEAHNYQPLILNIESFRQTAGRLIEVGDAQTVEVVREVTLEHKLGGHDIPPTFGERADSRELRKAERLLRMYERSPQVAQLLVERSVAGFHGSDSGTLISVLTHGLLSADAARQNQVALVSGERSYSGSGRGGQGWISYVDWAFLGTLNKYTAPKNSITTESLRQDIETGRMLLEGPNTPEQFKHSLKQGIEDTEAQIKLMTEHPDREDVQLMAEHFPVAYGINASDYTVIDWPTHNHLTEAQQREKIIGNIAPGSQDGEFLVWGKRVDPGDLQVIGVPSVQVDKVQALVDRYGYDIQVIPLEVLREEPLPTIAENEPGVPLADINKERHPQAQQPKYIKAVQAARLLLNKMFGK